MRDFFALTLSNDLLNVAGQKVASLGWKYLRFAHKICIRPNKPSRSSTTIHVRSFMYTWYKKISKLFLTKCAYSQCNLQSDSLTMKPNAWSHSKICRWLIVTSATQILTQFVSFVVRRPRLVVRQDIPTLGYNILR